MDWGKEGSTIQRDRKDKSKSSHTKLDLAEDRGSRQDFDGERVRKKVIEDRAQMAVQRTKEAMEMGKRLVPGSVIKVKEKQENVCVENESITFDNRPRRSAPVFLIKSERAAEERAALMAVGGVITKANGNADIKDFVDALKSMCSAYAKWSWKPIPVPQGIMFRFPSDVGLELLTKSDVIPCKNGQFFVKRWSEMHLRERFF